MICTHVFFLTKYLLFLCKRQQNGIGMVPHFFQSQNPVMMGPYKRIAVADAKGLPTMYQPISNIAYQQTLASMQTLQQPQFIPVSCKY